MPAPAAGSRRWTSKDRHELCAGIRSRAQANRQRDLEGQEQRLEDRRRRTVADRSYRPETKLTIWGTGNPWPLYDPRRAPATISTPTRRWGSTSTPASSVWHFQYLPNDSWDYDEIGVHMLYDEVINGEKRKVVAHFGPQRLLYSLDRAHAASIKAASM